MIRSPHNVIKKKSGGRYEETDRSTARKAGAAFRVNK